MKRLTFEQFKRRAREQIITFADRDGMDAALKIAYRASLDADPVLIVGDTGTGKELFANSIHKLGGRAKHKLIPVNCSVLRENDVEQKLFGVRAGAFSNVRLDSLGSFREADKGTLFLDELHRLPTGGRYCLLRVLETGEVARYGDDWSKADKVDVRIIAAGNGDVDNTGIFPQDLSARISRHRISLPPLQKRPRDILLLFLYYLWSYLPRDKRLVFISYHVLDFMVWYPWPRNVRELRDFVRFLIDEFKPPLISWFDVREFFRGREWDQSVYEKFVAPLDNPNNLIPEFVNTLKMVFSSPYLCWYDHIRMNRPSILNEAKSEQGWPLGFGRQSLGPPPHYPLKREWLHESCRDVNLEQADCDNIMENVFFDVGLMIDDLIPSYRESGGPFPFARSGESKAVASKNPAADIITKDDFYRSIAATLQHTGVCSNPSRT